MRKIGIGALALALTVATALAADPGKPAVITGEVVDTACWIGHNAKEPDHIKCAAMCARNGIPLAILDVDSDMLYLPIATDHKNPNTKLMDFIGSKARVAGNVIQKSGIKGIVIEKIERAN